MQIQEAQPAGKISITTKTVDVTTMGYASTLGSNRSIKMRGINYKNHFKISTTPGKSKDGCNIVMKAIMAVSVQYSFGFQPDE